MASSASSLVLQTPDNFDTHFSDIHSTSHDIHDSTISSNYDLSSSLIDNPAISSMEVELSICTEESPQIVDESYVAEEPYSKDPKTPARRASRVFDFLTEKKRSRAPEECFDRPLPDPPSAFSSPSDKGSTEGPLRSHFSSDNSTCESAYYSPATSIPLVQDTPQHRRSNAASETGTRNHRFSVHTPAPKVRVETDSSILSPTAVQNISDTVPSDLKPEDVQQARKVKVIMNAPTKVIVTAATPSTADVENRPPTRIPRGPRSLKQARRNSIKGKQRPTLLDRSNSANSSASPVKDPFTPVPSRPRKPHSQRVSSTSSWSLAESDYQLARQEDAKVRKSRRESGTRTVLEKENNLGRGLSVKSEIPSTPMRSGSSKSSRSLFRSIVDPGVFQPPPSPASSTELSPVGQKMMLDARKQRVRVRKDTQVR